MKLNKLKTNNYGFGHLEIILVVLVVAIIGVVGFTVFNSNNSKKTSAITSTKSLVATAKPPGQWALLGGTVNSSKIWGCAQYTPWGSTAAWTIKTALTQLYPKNKVFLSNDVIPYGNKIPVQYHQTTVTGSRYFLPDLLINPRALDGAIIHMQDQNTNDDLIIDIGGTVGKNNWPGFGGFGNPLYFSFHFTNGSLKAPKHGALPSCT